MGVGPSVLEDKYFLQKVKLGQGSFGVVWRGVEKASGATVAVKQMDKAQLPRRGVKREDIEREVSVMKVVEHENILRLYDFCEDRQYISFVLEYCDGGDFGDKVKERASTITEEEAGHWMKQILRSIAALHSKECCHRDIKPDNFMVSKSQVVKLADFGLATILPKGKLLNEKCGTPAFMAPEQINIGKSRGYNHSVDVWAAGITMFMLMSGGKHPFVDPAGKLDERRLQDGCLDFASQGLLGYFVQQGGFSEESKRFCKRLVNPKSADRLTAESALQESWMRTMAASKRSSTKEEGDVTRRHSNRDKPGGEAGGYPGAATPTGGDSSGFNVNNLVGWILGEDQNKPPNVNGETEQAIGKRLQAVSSQIDALQHSPGMMKENVDMKNRITELENEKRELRVKLEKADAKKRQQPVPASARDSYAQPDRITRRPTDVTGFNGYQVPITSINGARGSSGGLDAYLKVRYNSTSANRWLPATVERFNESNGTYDLSVRPQADVSNISPDPLAKTHEAWPEGTLVTYYSPTAGRSLDAIVVSFIEGTGGINGTYNLDLRECADVDRIRPRALR